MDRDRTKRKLSAIFSADVVGYSRLMEADEAWTIKSLEENKRLMGGYIEEYEGRIVDSPGDNMLAEFNSVINAVECAVEIQQELKRKNDNLSEARRMHFRIGINLGDVVEEDGRIYGNGVNIAARLESLADPGGICISSTAYDQVRSKLDIGYEYLGEHNVKNITIPVRAYRVLMDSKSAGKVIGEKKGTERLSRSIIVLAVVVIIVGAGWMLYSRLFQDTAPDITKTEESPAAADFNETLKTVAVLPFENLSTEKSQEYFADGIAEELLNSLTRISELEVRGRTSSFYFKDRKENIPTIAKMLNVEYLLEGSVRKAGEQVRITVQLIDTRRDAHIWSQTYDRTMDDIFAIQDDIAKSVANALQITLGVGELGRAPGMTRNPDAYDAFLAGRALMLKAGRDNISRAIKELEKAVALDPDFAICWYELIKIYGEAAAAWIPDKYEELRKKAEAAMSRLVELAPESDSVIQINVSGSNDAVEMEQLFTKGLALYPENYDLNYQYGWFLSQYGRPSEAIDCFKRLIRLEPLDARIHLYLGVTYSLSGDIDAAIMEYKKAAELTDDPSLPNTGLLAMGLEKNDRDLIDEYKDIDPVMHSLLDTPEEAVAELKRRLTDPAYLNPINTDAIAIWAAYFGDHELALQIYNEGIKSGLTSIFPIWRPIYKGMRGLPGFKDIVRETDLLEYWQKSGNWGEFCHPVGEDDFECE